VIVHEAIVVDRKAKTIAVTSQQTEEVAAIVVVNEDRLAVVAAIHEVIAGFFGSLPAARHARHRNLH
jgi:hypothetical protein